MTHTETLQDVVIVDTIIFYEGNTPRELVEILSHKNSGPHSKIWICIIIQKLFYLLASSVNDVSFKGFLTCNLWSS